MGRLTTFGILDFQFSNFYNVPLFYFGPPDVLSLRLRTMIWQFSFIIVSQPHGSESDYQNVEFLTFINPEHVIYDIGTEIRIFHCFATKMLKSFCKSIIFSGIESSRRDLAF